MNILRALDRSRYHPLLIGIDKQGHWFLQNEAHFLDQDANPKTVALKEFDQPIAIVPDGSHLPEPVAVFAILHGPNGEDGTIQGLFRQLNWPFVGPDVLGSAAAMDKDLAKRLMTEAGIPNSPFKVYRSWERDKIDFDALKKELQLPFFIKPACMGSSVGVTKVDSAEALKTAVDLAFRFDHKILIEQGIKGREIECAVLGNSHPKGSPIGEIVPQEDFYDYESKYIDADGAKLLLPAPNLNEAMVARIQALAVKTFQILECEGLSRVDFFLTETNKLYVNEVNTLPGFTSISMYPSLWELGGIAYQDLISQLIELAIERQVARAGLDSTM
ncbi:UNVERIFIED_CONTAM: hypothetical protein GTU68_057406 [Idotea baltica]|nr:hypothetical protein [Idotea baltica]